MLLTVERYNSLEKEGKKLLSNRFLEAFQPVTFDTLGYPCRIDSETEVFKFLDVMHDGRLGLYYNSEIYDYAPTYEEFEKIKQVTKNIYCLSKDKYGRGIVVKAPMLNSINVFRKLKFLSTFEDLPVIFEMGGGTGILGALLYQAGYKYISTDIAQAFYLTQNNLWEGLCPGCVEECIDSVENINVINSGKMTHIPYWKLWELRNSDLEADIMVANHCLAEMHANSLRFYLSYGKWLMRNSKYKLFIAQCPGYFHSGNNKYLLNRFDEMGYALIYSEKDFLIFCLKDKPDISMIDIEVLLRKYKGAGSFPIDKNVVDSTAASFERANQNILNTKKVSFEELQDYFNSLDENIDSPDEEFLYYCGDTPSKPYQRSKESCSLCIQYTDILDLLRQKKGKKVALYGAGYECNLLINELFKNNMENIVELIFDTDINRAGTKCRGYDIFYPTKQKLDDVDFIFITSSRYAEEINEFLLKQNIEKLEICKITSFLS